MNSLPRVIFWGICATLLFVPLPFGSDVEWAVFVFQCATFLLFALHLASRLATRQDEEEKEELGNSKMPLVLKILLIVFLATAVLHLIPLPSGLVRIISPRTAVLYGALQTAGSGAPHELGWRTLSLSPAISMAELVKYSFFALFTYLVFSYVRTKKQIQMAVIVMLSGAVFQAFYGLIELLGGTEKIFSFQRDYHLGSATGTFINRDHFSGFLEMLFPLSIGFLLVKTRFFSMNKGVGLKDRVVWLSQEGLQKALVFGLFSVIIGLGIFFSRSRSGIFIFFVTVFLMFFAFSASGEKGRKLSKIVRTVSVSVIFAVIAIGIKPIIARFSLTALSKEERPVFYKNTVAMIGDFPLVGTGLGTYAYAYPMYQTVHNYNVLEHAHNDYLELAAEGGLVGAAALIAAAFGLLGFILARWARRRDHFVRGVTLGCLLGIAAILLHSFTDFNLRIPANIIYFLTLYALALRTVGQNHGGAVFRRRSLAEKIAGL